MLITSSARGRCGTGVFLCLWGLLPVAAAGPSEHLRDVILSGVEKYDPAIRKAHLESQSSRESASASSPRRRSTAVPSEPTKASSTDEPVLILPVIVVEGKTDKQPVALPRLKVPAPARNLPTQPFETLEVRRARLVKKHFTNFEQALNRRTIPLVGQSLEARAAKMESRESAALQLNEIADNLELAVALGVESEEEQKELRAELLRLYYGRPR